MKYRYPKGTEVVSIHHVYRALLGQRFKVRVEKLRYPDGAMKFIEIWPRHPVKGEPREEEYLTPWWQRYPRYID